MQEEHETAFSSPISLPCTLCLAICPLNVHQAPGPETGSEGHRLGSGTWLENGAQCAAVAVTSWPALPSRGSHCRVQSVVWLQERACTCKRG